MKGIVYIWFFAFLLLSGCYTLLRHPSVQKKDRPESAESMHKVVVDEDCFACHDQFNVISHFAPLSAHQDGEWFSTPWWFDNNYKILLGSSERSDQPVINSSVPSENSTISKSATPAVRRAATDRDQSDSQEIQKSASADSTDQQKREENNRKKKNTNRRKFRKRN